MACNYYLQEEGKKKAFKGGLMRQIVGGMWTERKNCKLRVNWLEKQNAGGL